MCVCVIKLQHLCAIGKCTSYFFGYLLLLVVKLLPSNAAAQTASGYTSLGSKAIQRGEYVLALDYLNKALGISSYNAEAFFLRGYTKYELDDAIGAERDFGEAIRLNPRNHEAYLYRGVARSDQMRYHSAFEDFNQALRLNDKDWRIYANRAYASLYLERYVDVIADCNRIINLKKQNSQTYLLRGEAKFGLEMYKVAIEDFNKSISEDSTLMQPVLRRGIARTKLEQYDDAIEDYEFAMQLDSSSMLPVFYRGMAYADMGKYEQALRDFNAVLEKYPKNEVVLFNRAMLYGTLNKKSEALLDYNEVLRLNPKNILGHFNRALLFLEKKELDKSLKDLDKALELFPEFVDAYETKLEILKRKGDQKAFMEATTVLEEVRKNLFYSDEEVEEQQRIKLLKLTELKGDFQQTPQEVGKVQNKEIDIRLLPFYRISPFPETDSDISVYDGYGRPFYNLGVITFTEETPQLSIEEAKQVLFGIIYQEDVEPTELVRAIPIYARLREFGLAYNELNKRIADDEKQAAYFFARANLAQIELELRQQAHLQKIGSLDIVDTVYQNAMEQLIARAEVDYRKVIELDSSMSFAHFNLGHLLATAERYEEAEVQFGKAAAVRGNFIKANYNRGLIRLLLGKTTLACEDLSLAGELGFTDAYSVINQYCD